MHGEVQGRILISALGYFSHLAGKKADGFVLGRRGFVSVSEAGLFSPFWRGVVRMLLSLRNIEG